MSVKAERDKNEMKLKFVRKNDYLDGKEWTQMKNKK